jgi:hypothetical protein
MKDKIKDMLRESGVKQHQAPVKKVKSSKEAAEENKSEKITKLLQNDIINHAAVVRKMTGEEWTGNSEATNRSKFRKKLNRMTNDEGGSYAFDEDEIGQIEKILMGLSSTINNTIGRQGK